MDQLRAAKKSKYLAAVDVMGGLDAGDFVPWLSMAGKVAGAATTSSANKPGGSSGSTDDAIKKAIEEAKRKDEADRQAKSTQNMMMGILGILGAGVIGGGLYLALKK